MIGESWKRDGLRDGCIVIPGYVRLAREEEGRRSGEEDPFSSSSWTSLFCCCCWNHRSLGRLCKEAVSFRGSAACLERDWGQSFPYDVAPLLHFVYHFVLASIGPVFETSWDACGDSCLI